jgi:hypothetical protein
MTVEVWGCGSETPEPYLSQRNSSQGGTYP